MEKHNKIAPPMGSTQSLEEAADIKAANSRYIIEKMKELLASKNSLKVEGAK